MSPNKRPPVATAGKSTNRGATEIPNGTKSGVIPINFDANKGNNPPIRFMVIVPGNAALSASFEYVDIPSGKFTIGSTNEQSCIVVKQAIYDILVGTLKKLIPVELDLEAAFQDLIENAFHPTAIGGHQRFSFAVLGDSSASRFTFAAAAKYFFQSGMTSPGIACFMPPEMVEIYYGIATSYLLDGPDDSDMDRYMPFLPDHVQTAWKEHVTWKKDGRSPYKSFSDSLFQRPDGAWNSSITLFMAEEIDPASQIPPPSGAETSAGDPPTVPPQSSRNDVSVSGGDPLSDPNQVSQDSSGTPERSGGTAQRSSSSDNPGTAPNGDGTNQRSSSSDNNGTVPPTVDDRRTTNGGNRTSPQTPFGPRRQSAMEYIMSYISPRRTQPLPPTSRGTGNGPTIIPINEESATNESGSPQSQDSVFPDVTPPEGDEQQETTSRPSLDELRANRDQREEALRQQLQQATQTPNPSVADQALRNELLRTEQKFREMQEQSRKEIRELQANLAHTTDSAEREIARIRLQLAQSQDRERALQFEREREHSERERERATRDAQLEQARLEMQRQLDSVQQSLQDQSSQSEILRQELQKVYEAKGANISQFGDTSNSHLQGLGELAGFGNAETQPKEDSIHFGDGSNLSQINPRLSHESTESNSTNSLPRWPIPPFRPLEETTTGEEATVPNPAPARTVPPTDPPESTVPPIPMPSVDPYEMATGKVGSTPASTADPFTAAAMRAASGYTPRTGIPPPRDATPAATPIPAPVPGSTPLGTTPSDAHAAPSFCPATNT